MASEWVGGVVSTPFLVGEGDDAYRPAMALWLELATDLIVGQQVVPPAEREGALGRTLEAALERPLAGEPRSPARIRIADAQLAEEVRRVVRDAIPIHVAPTPEIDALLENLAAYFASREGPEPSYLEGGSIAPAAVARLFQAALPLFVTAPWKVADDDHVVRMDIPALGVEGACLSIIGKLGQSRGVIIFPSLAGYRAFVAMADIPAERRRDFGTPWIALTFESPDDLSGAALTEAERHGWKVVSKDAYPWVQCHGRDGMPRTTTEQDVKVTSACAEALAAFFIRHESVFTDDPAEPVCESCFDNDDLEVRFTRPYEAAPSFDIAPHPQD